MSTGAATLLLPGPKMRRGPASLRHESADILSLEAALRPPRSEHVGRARASPAQRAPAHLDAGVGRARVVPAQAISALGQRQAQREKRSVSTSMVGGILAHLKRR